MSYIPAFQGTRTVCPGAVAGVPSVTNIDYLLTQPGIGGLQMMLTGQSWDDTIDCSLVDIDGVIAPPNTVLNVSVTNGYINAAVALQDTFDKQPTSEALVGTYLRIAYKATGPNSVVVRINYEAYAWKD